MYPKIPSTFFGFSVGAKAKKKQQPSNLYLWGLKGEYRVLDEVGRQV